MKLITPMEVMAAQMTVPLPGGFILFIAVAEVAGALGLVLPGLLRIQKQLTPLPASGLITIMIGAVVISVLTLNPLSALMPLVTGLLCTTVATGRRCWFFNR